MHTKEIASNRKFGETIYKLLENLQAGDASDIERWFSYLDEDKQKLLFDSVKRVNSFVKDGTCN